MMENFASRWFACVLNLGQGENEIISMLFDENSGKIMVREITGAKGYGRAL